MRRNLLQLSWRPSVRSASPARPRVEALEARIAFHAPDNLAAPVVSFSGADLPPGFSETQLASGIDRPTAMEVAPDGRIFIAEETGVVRIVQDGNLLPTPFFTLDRPSGKGGGLYGITVDPDFATNGFVYLYNFAYALSSDDTTPDFNRVTRVTANGNVADPGSAVTIFELDPYDPPVFHNGGALHFGPDGKLYISTGDSHGGNNPQSLESTDGKILRINADGSIPTDNPFFDQTTGNKRAIYALGFRNPYTMAFDPYTGRLFINDVGNAKFEEINEGLPGANYGWPLYEGPAGVPGFTDPLVAFPVVRDAPSTRNAIAFVGAAFYSPQTVTFPDEYVGDYFWADFGYGWIRHYDPNTGANNLFATEVGPFPVDLRVTPDGGLIVLSRTDVFAPNSAKLTRIDYTTDDQRFVQALYHDFLDRTGSTSEINAWVSQLPTLGRDGVAAAIGRSPEALAHTVGEVYETVLGRPADLDGRAGWVSFLQGGGTLEQLLVGFVTSDEFAARADAQVGGTDPNANFVISLYQVLLNRTPDEAEVLGWVPFLNDTGDRATVAEAFVTSAEFRSGNVRTFYGDLTQSPRPYQGYLVELLRRPLQFAPSTADVNGWVNSDRDLLSIGLAFAGTDEYYSVRSRP